MKLKRSQSNIPANFQKKIRSPKLHSRQAPLFTIKETRTDTTEKGLTERIKQQSKIAEMLARQKPQCADDSSDYSMSSRASCPEFSATPQYFNPYQFQLPYLQPMAFTANALAGVRSPPPTFANFTAVSPILPPVRPDSASSGEQSLSPDWCWKERCDWWQDKTKKNVNYESDSSASNFSEPARELRSRKSSPVKGILTSRTFSEHKKAKKKRKTVRFREEPRFKMDSEQTRLHSQPVTKKGNQRREEFLQKFQKKYKI